MITSKNDKRRFLIEEIKKAKEKAKQNNKVYRLKKDEIAFLKNMAMYIRKNGLISTLNRIYFTKQSELKKITNLINTYIDKYYTDKDIISLTKIKSKDIVNKDFGVKGISSFEKNYKSTSNVVYQDFKKRMKFLFQFRELDREDYMNIQYDLYELGMVFKEYLFTIGGEK